MSFDERDIRPTMDVYTRDNVYLGTVLAVLPGSPVDAAAAIEPGARQSSAIGGEALGPMPTQAVGNGGPANQSAQADYASRADARPLGQGAIAVGRWWGLVGRRTLPLAAVETVSLERVVLRLTSEDLPA